VAELVDRHRERTSQRREEGSKLRVRHLQESDHAQAGNNTGCQAEHHIASPVPRPLFDEQIFIASVAQPDPRFLNASYN